MADNVFELVDDDDDSEAVARIAPSSTVIYAAKVGRLDGSDFLFREQAKVYRSVRAGRLRSEDGYRLVRMLSELRATRESMLIEAQIEELQRAAGIK